MTRDDIEAFFKSINFSTDDEDSFQIFWDFAKVVAAAEREVIAKMIEDVPPLVRFAQNDKGGCLMCGFTPKLAAETIRARSK